MASAASPTGAGRTGRHPPVVLAARRQPHPDERPSATSVNRGLVTTLRSCGAAATRMALALMGGPRSRRRRRPTPVTRQGPSSSPRGGRTVLHSERLRTHEHRHVRATAPRPNNPRHGVRRVNRDRARTARLELLVRRLHAVAVGERSELAQRRHGRQRFATAVVGSHLRRNDVDRLDRAGEIDRRDGGDDPDPPSDRRGNRRRYGGGHVQRATSPTTLPRYAGDQYRCSGSAIAVEVDLTTERVIYGGTNGAALRRLITEKGPSGRLLQPRRGGPRRRQPGLRRFTGQRRPVGRCPGSALGQARWNDAGRLPRHAAAGGHRPWGRRAGRGQGSAGLPRDGAIPA